MGRLVTLLLVLACAAVVALPAGAAEPESATLDGGHPTTTWTGAITDPTGSFELGPFFGGSIPKTPGCKAPVCDTVTLHVAAAGTKLSVTVTGEDPTASIGVQINPPSGDPVFADDGETTATATLANPAAGDYEIWVVAGGDPPGPEFPYSGKATLDGVAAPSPTATQTTAATPAATASATPAPSAPAATPTPAPARDAAAPKPTLAAHADKRPLRKAARLGFRVRLRCTLACFTVTAKLYLSPLVARQLHVPFKEGEDVLVGRTATLFNAEGRHSVRAEFKASLRKRLARKKQLPLALTVIATDGEGRARSYSQRIVLSR